MPTNDSALKVLLRYAPQTFVDSFFPGARFLEALPTEFAREPLRADALLRVQFPAVDGTPLKLHFEFQTKADGAMRRRLCLYMLNGLERDDEPVLSIVVFLEPCQTPVSPWVIAGPRGPILTFDFIVVRLWEIPVEEWLNPAHQGVLPLVPLLQGATVEMLGQVADLLQSVPEPSQRSNALYYTIAFAKRAFGVTAVNDFLRRNLVIDAYIKDSPFYQEIIDLGQSQGLSQGLNQGLSQGREQGELIGLREAIVEIVALRSPELRAEIAQSVEAITDLPRLRRLVARVAGAADAAATRQAVAEA